MSADFLRNGYFGGWLESAGGGAAVPLLLDESGGLVDGLDWSAGGVLCMEFEDELESAGAAGAAVEESEGALGDVDCCFEHATIASALKHNKRRLRFISSPHCISIYVAVHLAIYLTAQADPPPFGSAGWNTTLRRKQRSATAFFSPGKLEATATLRTPDMLRALAVL